MTLTNKESFLSFTFPFLGFHFIPQIRTNTSFTNDLRTFFYTKGTFVLKKYIFLP